MVDRTLELLEIIQIGGSKDAIVYPKSPSLFLIKANSLFLQIESFEKVLHRCFDGYVGYHRFLPGKMILGKLTNFTDQERKELMEEVIAFLSLIAKNIQQLNHHLDTTYHDASLPSQNAFYQQAISSLLQKLQRFSKFWDNMQKEQKRNCYSSCRLFSHFYSGNCEPRAIKTTSNVAENSSSSSRDAKNKAVELIKPVQTKLISAPDKSFAERFVDEIAPPSKMREYEQVATQQKDLLLRESKSLQRKFSQDMAQSQQIENSVMSLSSMIAEFATLIESQSEIVGDVGEAAKDATHSVKLADQELLSTIERSQSYQWSMIALIFGASFLLMFLHFISP